MAKKRLIVLRNEANRKELVTRFAEQGYWVSEEQDRVAKGDEVVHIRVLGIYIDGLDALNDLFAVEADFSDVFSQLVDLKKVLSVTKEYVERSEKNEYPEEEKEE